MLVVDDEQALSELVSLALRYEGWQVQLEYTGAAAVAAQGTDSALGGRSAPLNSISARSRCES